MVNQCEIGLFDNLYRTLIKLVIFLIKNLIGEGESIAESFKTGYIKIII